MSSTAERQEYLDDSDDDLLTLESQQSFDGMHQSRDGEQHDLLGGHGEGSDLILPANSMMPVRRHPLAKLGIGALAGLHVVAEGVVDAYFITMTYRYINGGAFLDRANSYPPENTLLVAGSAFASVLLPKIATILPGYAVWMSHSIRRVKERKLAILGFLRRENSSVVSAIAMPLWIANDFFHVRNGLGGRLAFLPLCMTTLMSMSIGRGIHLAFAHQHNQLRAQSPHAIKVFYNDIVATQELLPKLKKIYLRYGAFVGNVLIGLAPAVLRDLKPGTKSRVTAAVIGGLYSAFTAVLDTSFAYDSGEEEFAATPYAKLALGLQSVLFSLPAVLVLAKMCYQWDETEYLHQVLNSYVLIAAAVVVMPPVARSHYLSSVRFIDSQLSKAAYQLRECAPRSWRRDEFGSDRRCTDGCLSWMRSTSGNRGERAGLLSAEPRQSEANQQGPQRT